MLKLEEIGNPESSKNYGIVNKRQKNKNKKAIFKLPNKVDLGDSNKWRGITLLSQTSFS